MYLRFILAAFKLSDGMKQGRDGDGDADRRDEEKQRERQTESTQGRRQRGRGRVSLEEEGDKQTEGDMNTEGNERLPLIVAGGLVGQTVHYSELTNR